MAVRPGAGGGPDFAGELGQIVVGAGEQHDQQPPVDTEGPEIPQVVLFAVSAFRVETVAGGGQPGAQFPLSATWLGSLPRADISAIVAPARRAYSPAVKSWSGSRISIR